MPLYVVRCDYCDHEWEIKCKYSELEEAICPDCKEKVYAIPAACGFKINGHSYSNGYNKTKELDYSYQGYDTTWDD